MSFYCQIELYPNNDLILVLPLKPLIVKGEENLTRYKLWRLQKTALGVTIGVN